VLEDSLERLEVLTENGGTTAWRWQTRVAAASAVMAATRAAHLSLPEHLLHKGTQLICALLSNEAYQARVQGTRIVPKLLQAGTRMQVCMLANFDQDRGSTSDHACGCAALHIICKPCTWLCTAGALA
jgi:hypothetical protein